MKRARTNRTSYTHKESGGECERGARCSEPRWSVKMEADGELGQALLGVEGAGEAVGGLRRKR